MDNQGVLQGQECLVELAKIYHRRQVEYAKLIHDIHDIILRVTKAHRERRRTMHLDLAGGSLLGGVKTRIVPVSEWVYPKLNQGRRLQMRPLPEDMKVAK